MVRAVPQHEADRRRIAGSGYRMRDIDVDQNRAMATKYGIRSIPTFVFLENGNEVSRFSGGTSARPPEAALLEPDLSVTGRFHRATRF